MKTRILFFVCTVFFSIPFASAQSQSPDVSVLEGYWKLDMTPENPSDSNFAQMIITSTKDNQIQGSFYRDGVSMKEGRINTQTGVIHAALVSQDNSGKYNTSFYYEDGKLYGTTHSLSRDFLSVWTASKVAE